MAKKPSDLEQSISIKMREREPVSPGRGTIICKTSGPGTQGWAVQLFFNSAKNYDTPFHILIITLLIALLPSASLSLETN